MDIIKTFGGIIEDIVPKNPVKARKLLLAGYRAQKAVLTVNPDRKLPPSKQYAAKAVMDVTIRALAHPENAAMISILTPCEPLTAAGITPYSVEALSGYISGTKCDKVFLEHTAGEGMPETLCSFHRTFDGAADIELLPKPKFMVYTNIPCDGNMITFPYLRRKFDIPHYFIDVPYEKSEDAVQDVAAQLREMKAFIEDITGKKITDELLMETISRSKRTYQNYIRYLDFQKERHLTGDTTSEMYAVFMTHNLLGTKEAEKYSKMLLEDIQKAPLSKALRLLWIHLLPYMQPSIKKMFNFSKDVFITTCDLAYESMIPIDETRPYESMARRMVYSCFNGSPEGRINRALEMARTTGADGAVIFAQWGCKSTIGITRIMKKALESQGLPSLILDGDACDLSNSSDGQIATRIGAFIEMLEGKCK